eukprot:TRINITY_DN215_c1_g1_i1.p1 TRINITY_DN215_c1_g1~~TRINITY_DN215_c1_g1_i1.p1  ORF type:complete len:388 (+),score=97.65 TRINITY_DN215_c1_g1_i1:1394-2557(+)
MIELTTEIFIAYTCILLMSVGPIFIGSYMSVYRILPSKDDEKKDKNSSKGGIKSSSSVQINTETLSSKDAYMFPVIGSITLFGFYVLFKLFPKEYVNFILTIYFLMLGIGALATSLTSLLSAIPTLSNLQKYTIRSPIKKLNLIKVFDFSEWKYEFTILNIFCLVCCSGVGVWYGLTKHWIANNIFGLAFSIQGVALISPGSYKVGCIMLSGLFFYDIFWVFGTDVMVTVAKSFDAPIKLLFPKNIFTTEEFQFSMLGLGDIVIPGLFIALLLRYDYFRGGLKSSYSKPYFFICFISYILGLVTTIGVMHIFEHAQPALLYLVPYCIFSSLFTGIIRGELGSLFDYSEGGLQLNNKSKNENSDNEDLKSDTTKSEDNKESSIKNKDD